MRARRSSELNLLKVDPMAEEGPPGPPPEEDSSGGCEVMCSSCEPEREERFGNLGPLLLRRLQKIPSHTVVFYQYEY